MFSDRWYFMFSDYFFSDVISFLYGSKDLVGFGWFDHRSSIKFDESQMHRLKSQKSSSYVSSSLICCCRKAGVLLQLLYERDQTVHTHRSKIKSEKIYIYTFMTYCTIADMEHVNWFGPPIWYEYTNRNQQEVSCFVWMLTKRIWSFGHDTHTHTSRTQHRFTESVGIKNTIPFRSR